MILNITTTVVGTGMTNTNYLDYLRPTGDLAVSRGERAVPVPLGAVEPRDTVAKEAVQASMGRSGRGGRVRRRRRQERSTKEPSRQEYI